MSDRGEDRAPFGDGEDAGAGEYVLGTLPLAERVAFEARLRIEPGLRLSVAAWEAHFAPLNDAYAPVPAPNLLPRIEARLFPQARRRRLGLFGLLGGALIAGAVAIALLGPFNLPVQPDLVATLGAADQPLVFAASYDIETASLTVRRTAGDAAAAGQDYQLWVIGASGVPQSLGVMAAAEVTVTLAGLQPADVLAVSLEAAGGSVTGAPTTVLVTGPVIEPATDL